MLIRVRNSFLVFIESCMLPSMEDVVMSEFCFSTPRIIMHKCCASMTTATPCADAASMTAHAIWLVSRS